MEGKRKRITDILEMIGQLKIELSLLSNELYNEAHGNPPTEFRGDYISLLKEMGLVEESLSEHESEQKQIAMEIVKSLEKEMNELTDMEREQFLFLAGKRYAFIEFFNLEN